MSSFFKPSAWNYLHLKWLNFYRNDLYRNNFVSKRAVTGAKSESEKKLFAPSPHSVAPCKVCNPDFGMRSLETRGISVCGILNPGLWNRNSAEGIRNPTKDCNQESKFLWQGIRNSVPGIRNPQRETQNPRLSWITSQGAKTERLEQARKNRDLLSHSQLSSTCLPQNDPLF